MTHKNKERETKFNSYMTEKGIINEEIRTVNLEWFRKLYSLYDEILADMYSSSNKIRL